MNEPKDRGVLIIYTGGTIGCLPNDRNDPLSPLEPAPIEDVVKWLPTYDSVDRRVTVANRHIRIGTESFDPPLDSSNIKPENWLEMAMRVKDNYDKYEGFVLLHGTDTLAYTASALSFMLENLSKPVVITGSQRPIGELRSDAVQNLITAIEIAASRSLGKTVVAEVSVFFRDKLTRGCRTTKLSANSYYAFDSPNLKPLATAGEHVAYDETIIRQPSTQRLHIHSKLQPKVASFDVFPGISPELIRKILSEDLKGAVIQTFGAGNAPNESEFLKPIGDAVEHGTLLLNVTQCRQGEVEQGLYDVSAGLLARGVVSGMDMTPEAALSKLFVVLGDVFGNDQVDSEKTEDASGSRYIPRGATAEEKADIAADILQLNMRGEQRVSVFNLHFPAGGFNDHTQTKQCLTPLREMVAGRGRLDHDAVEQALLRVTGLKIPDQPRGIIQFRAFIDDPDADENSPHERKSALSRQDDQKLEQGSGSGFHRSYYPASPGLRRQQPRQHDHPGQHRAALHLAQTKPGHFRRLLRISILLQGDRQWRESREF